MIDLIVKNINVTTIQSILTSNQHYAKPIQYLDFNVANYFYEKSMDKYMLKDLILYPDSTAVYIYLKLFKGLTNSKIKSTDLQNDMLHELNIKAKSIFLFGGIDSVLQKTVKEINVMYPSITVNGVHNGYNYDNKDMVIKINESNSDVLFVGLGAGRQEKWILENRHSLNTKVVISVGGWFEYLSKSKKRAPFFLRNLNLEWLFKLIIEFPRVWKRYLIGIPKFYYRVLTKKINLYYEV
ncbi:MAG: WecB/TagA/CpsF family glycosyl transferase [Stygiobacter sp.]|nr:MAG: WecB/TagA/CpsF family glycosyl transferase [Stygiobacter sp.]